MLQIYNPNCHLTPNYWFCYLPSSLYAVSKINASLIEFLTQCAVNFPITGSDSKPDIYISISFIKSVSIAISIQVSSWNKSLGVPQRVTWYLIQVKKNKERLTFHTPEEGP